MISLSIQGNHGTRGHLACSAYGDDGRLHLTAYRKQGNPLNPQIVQIGQYAVTIAELEIFLKQARELEAQRTK